MRHLKDRETKQIIKDFTTKYPSSVEQLSFVEHLEELTTEDALVFFADGKPWILRTTKGLLPSLKFEAMLKTFPKVIVDMGAVPHIANGAQIMRPGVRSIEGQFAKDELVVILDEKYRKTIALGISEVDSETMKSMTKGRVINNIHYVGDPVWNAFATVKS
ncbi:MAG: PUA domain-containing protein [Candidatus Bathyarchaeia archaeon]